MAEYLGHERRKVYQKGMPLAFMRKMLLDDLIRRIASMLRQLRLLQNPPDAAPDGLRPRGFAGFFAEAVGPTLNKRTRQGHRCIFWPFSDRRRRPGPVAGGFSEAGVRLGQGQASILSICSAAMTSKPKARCAATLTGPRTRTCRPPCSSCRWLLTRSTAVRSL